MAPAPLPSYERRTQHTAPVKDLFINICSSAFYPQMGQAGGTIAAQFYLGKGFCRYFRKK